MTKSEAQALHQTAYFATRQEEADAFKYLNWAYKDNDEGRKKRAKETIHEIRARKMLHQVKGWPEGRVDD